MVSGFYAGGVGGVWCDDVDVSGLHNFRFIYGVGVVALGGSNIDVVTLLDFFYAIQYCTVGLAVAGEGEVSFSPGIAVPS